jgi:hypothetical protein
MSASAHKLTFVALDPSGVLPSGSRSVAAFDDQGIFEYGVDEDAGDGNSVLDHVTEIHLLSPYCDMIQRMLVPEDVWAGYERARSHHAEVKRSSEKAEERAAALREEMVKTEALLLSAFEAIDDARAERVARGSDYYNERKRQGTYKLDHYSEPWVTMNFRIY